MIHPPAIRITCDGPDCDPVQVYYPVAWAIQSVLLPPRRAVIEQWLTDWQGWIVRAGQHFCSQVCADARAEPPFNPVHERSSC